MKVVRLGGLLGAVFVLAACGTGTTTAPPPETTTVELDTTTSEPATTASASAEDAASAGFLAVGGCYEASVAVSAAMSTALAGPFAELGIEAETSPEVDLARLAADAPEEIADDLTTVADALGAYYETIADAGIDLSDPATLTPEAVAALEDAAAAFESSEFQAASDGITAWFEENCPAS